MKILGIESTCDESAVAVVQDGHQVLSTVLSSQIERHNQFGGVVPELAAREHLKAIPAITMQAIKVVPKNDLDAIAVAYTPGLIPALLVGLSYAKGLAASLDVPFIGINHIAAHVFSSFIDHPTVLAESKIYPILALIVSGGHTLIVKLEQNGVCRIVGRTLDDAAGEAFDKGARLLKLGYPGGPIIERLARKGNAKRYDFPQGLIGSGGKPLDPKHRFDFSFSGIKTALLYHLRGYPSLSIDRQEILDSIASYQEAILDVLIKKLYWAAKAYDTKTLVLCGGVACNQRLRTKINAIAEELDSRLYIAAPHYCTDNAVMIAGLSYYYLRNKQSSHLDLDVEPRLNILQFPSFIIEQGGRK